MIVDFEIVRKSTSAPDVLVENVIMKINNNVVLYHLTLFLKKATDFELFEPY